MKCMRFVSKHLWNFPMDVLVKIIFYGNVDKSLWCCYEQKDDEYTKYKLTVDTAIHPMPMVDILLVIPFIYTV